MLTMSFSQAIGYSDEYRKDNQIIDIVEKSSGPLAPDWYYKPSDYDELVSWYLDLESNYPDYLEVFKANELYGTGTATGGYDIYYVRITNENLGLHKPEVLFLGSPHGDETVGGIGLYWFTDWLMRMAFTDETHEEFSKDYLKWIIDNREIYANRQDMQRDAKRVEDRKSGKTEKRKRGALLANKRLRRKRKFETNSKFQYPKFKTKAPISFAYCLLPIAYWIPSPIASLPFR